MLSLAYPVEKMRNNVEISLVGVPTVKLNPSFAVATVNVTIQFRNTFRLFRVRVLKADTKVRMLRSLCASQQALVQKWVKSAGGKIDCDVEIILTDGVRKMLTEQWDKTNKLPLVFEVLGSFETFWGEFDVTARLEGPVVPDVWRID